MDEELSKLINSILLEKQSQTEILRKQADIQNNILKELKNWADVGEYYLVQGTATTTLTDNLIDIPATLGMPEIKVSAYMIINDGTVNNIRVGHNVTTGMVTSATDIVGQARSKFYNVRPGEDITIRYNRKVIENIYIITSAGTSAFRLWLFW